MNFLKKIISLIIINCFLFSFVCGELIAAEVADMKNEDMYKQIFTDFVLPYSYGKITDFHFASTDRLIINIQDLHCHPEVQKNISNIIELFDKKYGVKNIYLEGAYGEIDTQWLKTESINKKNTPADKMIETGRLTGAEYYSVKSGRTSIIKGIEEKEAYLENLKRLGTILENKEETEVILNAINEATQKLKSKYYERRQLKLEELSDKYAEGKIGAEKYFKLMSKHIDKLGIDLTKYENTLNYMMLLSEQKMLNFERTTKELQSLVMVLKQKLPYKTYKMLLDSTDNFSKMDKLYGYVIIIAKQYNFNLSLEFPELDRYFKYIELSQKINPLELVKEEKKLVNEINTKFARTKVQREIVFLVNFGKYLENYLTNKITAEDYEYYLQNIKMYKQLWNSYVDTRVLSLLDPYMDEADKFYKINSDRNKYFADNVLNGSETLQIIPNEEKKDGVTGIFDNIDKIKRVDVIVTGGFHTDSVSKILKDNNISYIVITPNVTGGTKLAEKTYYKIAAEQSKISFQTLAVMALSLQVMLLKEQGIPLETIKETLTKNSGSGLIPLIESAFHYETQISGRERLSEKLKELMKETKLAGILNFDQTGNIKEKVAGLLGIDVSLLEYIDAEKLVSAWENNDSDYIKSLIKNAQIRQDYSSGKDYLGRIFSEIMIMFNEIKENNTVNCAVESVYFALSPAAKPNKVILAFIMSLIDRVEKINSPNGYNSLYSIWRILKNQGYEAYAADAEILKQAVSTGRPVILAVSSNAIKGEINHYITVTSVVGTKSVIIHDINYGDRIVSEEDLSKILENEYGWQENGNVLVSEILKEESPLTADNMKQIYGADKKNISLKEQMQAVYADTGAHGYVDIYLEDILSDEKIFIETVRQAVESNKLIVIRMFRKSYNQDLLTVEELSQKYKEIKKMIKSFSNLEKLFPDVKKVFEMPSAYGAGFFLSEMLKNAFVHGNQGNDEPIIMHLKINKNRDISDLSVYNIQKNSELDPVRKKLAAKAGLTGYHIGTSIMLLNYFRTFKSGVRSLDGIKFYAAKSQLRKKTSALTEKQSAAINQFFEKHAILKKTATAIMGISATLLKLAGLIIPSLLLMSLFGTHAGIFIILSLTAGTSFALTLIQDKINKKSGQIKNQSFKQKASAWLQITQVASIIIIEWQIQFVYDMFLRIVSAFAVREDKLFEEQINADGVISLKKVKNVSQNILMNIVFNILNVGGYSEDEINKTMTHKMGEWVVESYISPAMIVKWLSGISSLSVPYREYGEAASERYTELNENVGPDNAAIEKTKEILTEFRRQFKSNVDYIEQFLNIAKERELTKSEQNLLTSHINIVATALEVLLMDAVYFDSYTRGHAEHVAANSIIIYDNIPEKVKEKYPPYFSSYIKMAALLHDIGKNSIPIHILNKPGALSDAEYSLMKLHGLIGAEILAETGFGFLSEDVNAHHEKYDGTGYSSGISGDKISLAASIIALADSYDSMSRDRVYRQALPKREVIRDIKNNRGKQFNPAVVDAFFRAVNILSEIRDKEELNLKKKIWIAQIIQTEILNGQMSPDEIADLTVLMTKDLTFKDKDAICNMLVFKNDGGKKSDRYKRFKIGSDTYLVYGIFDGSLKYGQYRFEVLKDAIYGGLTSSEKNARIDVEKNTITKEWLEKITRAWSQRAKKRFMKMLKLKNVDPSVYEFIDSEKKRDYYDELTLSEIIDVYAVLGDINTGADNDELTSKIGNFNIEQQKLVTKKIMDKFLPLSPEIQRQIYMVIGAVIFESVKYLNNDDISEEEYDNIIKTFIANGLNYKITLETVQNLNLGPEGEIIKEILTEAFGLKTFPGGFYAKHPERDGTETGREMIREVMNSQNADNGKKITLCVVSSAKDNFSAVASVILGYVLEKQNIKRNNVVIKPAGVYSAADKKSAYEEYGGILDEKGYPVGNIEESEIFPFLDYYKFDYFLAVGEEYRQNLINTYNIPYDKIILIGELLAGSGKVSVQNPYDDKISRRRFIDLLQKIFEKSFNIENLETKIEQKQDKTQPSESGFINFFIKAFTAFKSLIKISSVSDLSIKIYTYTEFSRKTIKTKEDFDIKTYLLIVDDEQQAYELRRQGFNAVQIEYAKHPRGEKIGPVMENQNNGSTIRAVWDENSKKIYVYSNSEDGLDGVNIREVKEALQRLHNEGKEFEAFKEITKIILPDSSLRVSSVVNKILNKEKDSITRPNKEINLDIRTNRANFEALCRENLRNGIRVMTISAKQAKLNKKTIKTYQQSGMAFILAPSKGESAEYIIRESEKFELNGAVLILKEVPENRQKIILEKAGDFAAKSMMNKKLAAGIHIYAEDIPERLFDIDIHQKYGIIPVFENMRDAKLYLSETGKKYTVKISEEISSADMEQILNNDDVYGIMADEKGIEKIRNRSVITDTITEIFKPKTAKQLFETEQWKIRNAAQKFDIPDIESALKNDGVLSGFLSEIDNFLGDEEKTEDAVTVLLNEQNLLTGFTRARVEHFMEAGRYAEAVGCIKAAVMNSVEQKIITKEMNISEYNKYMAGQFRDARAILLIKLIMAGKNIEKLKDTDGFIDSDMTAAEYLNGVVLKGINQYIREILNEGYSVMPPADEQETETAVDMFNKFDLLSQDLFKQEGIVERVKISTFAVKNILGAA